MTPSFLLSPRLPAGIASSAACATQAAMSLPRAQRAGHIAPAARQGRLFWCPTGHLTPSAAVAGRSWALWGAHVS